MSKRATGLLTMLLVSFVFVLSSITVAANQQFKDVSSSTEGFKEIQYIYSQGIIKGYEDQTFRPQNEVTRAQAAKMLVLASGHEPVKVTQSRYADVNARLAPEAAGYIEKAVQLGYMRGTTSSTFEMNAPIKRSDMATALVKAFNLSTATHATKTNPFVDVKTGSELSKAVNALYYEGISRGDGKYFYPTSGVTRKHFALFVARGLNDTFKVNRDVAGVEAPDSAKAIAKARVNLEDDTLNVRATASASSKLLGSLAPNTVVHVFEKQGDWLKISYNNTFGYIHGGYTAWADQNGNTIVNTPIAKVQVTTAELNVRARGTVSSPIVGMVLNKEVVEVFKEDNGWYLIFVDGMPGYISKTYTAPVTSTTPTPTPPPPTTPVPSGSVLGKVTVPNLNVRSGPNSTYSSIGQLAQGKMVTVESVNGYWAKIKYDGKVGYTHKTYLKLLNQSGPVVKNRIIVIDAGHGGKDPGASSQGVTEKSIVLKVAKIVQQKLEADGAIVIMSRETDVYPTLEDRVALAKSQYAEIFVSVHVNAINNPVVSGTETFYNATSNDNGLESFYLATDIHRHIIRDADMLDRRVKEQSFYVNRMVDIPSVLLELGFITNASDFNKLTNSTYISKFANATYKGIVDYYSAP